MIAQNHRQGILCASNVSMNHCYHVKIGVTIPYPNIASTTHCKYGNSHISTKYSSVPSVLVVIVVNCITHAF